MAKSPLLQKVTLSFFGGPETRCITVRRLALTRWNWFDQIDLHVRKKKIFTAYRAESRYRQTGPNDDRTDGQLRSEKRSCDSAERANMDLMVSRHQEDLGTREESGSEGDGDGIVTYCSIPRVSEPAEVSAPSIDNYIQVRVDVDGVDVIRRRSHCVCDCFEPVT